MTFGDQTQEVVKSRTHYQRVAQDSRLLLGIVESIHKKKYLELSHGVTRYIADSAGKGKQYVDDERVDFNREDGLVYALIATVAEVLVGTGSIGPA